MCFTNKTGAKAEQLNKRYVERESIMLNTLFRTLTIKGKTIKNRFTVPAMVTNYCTRDGEATEKFIAYHESKAKGGWGLIITEDYAVDPIGRGFSYVAGLWDDTQIESHKELPKRVHRYGSVILAQIYHSGRQTSESVINTAPVAPSPIPCPLSSNIPKELTVDEINKLVGQFGDAAYRAQKCGFDGVEIHGAHGYLIAQFLSPYSNKRVDSYGGSLCNRVRFAFEIVKDIRAKCGNHFIISFRISVDEFIEGGHTIEDTKIVVGMLENAGIDVINVSAGVYASIDAMIPPSYVKHAWIVDLAAEIKNCCTIPVIAVGRINDPNVADNVVKNGKADLIAMGRASLIDPFMPNKAKEGNFDDIRQCIGCNHGCLGMLFSDCPIKCSLNPELGNEHKGIIERTNMPKKIAIVGAGPAGLEAAIYAAQIGHEVVVFEKDSKAGGRFYLASIPPCKGEISAFIQWQLNQLKKLKVQIQYNTEISVDYFSNNTFDQIIIATGSKPTEPSINGVNLPHVVTANEVLAGIHNVENNVVVIGGGQVGAETANYLGFQLKNVTLIEMRPAIAADEALTPRWHLLRSLEKQKVKIMTNTTVQEIKPKYFVLKTEDSLFEIPADSVVVATGSHPNNTLASQLTMQGLPVKVIGDAKKVGCVLDATEQGYQIALSI